MLQFIHARYDDNQEVMSLIEVLRKWSKYETFNYLEIFQLQDECYFWYDFCMHTAHGKLSEKHTDSRTKKKHSPFSSGL